MHARWLAFKVLTGGPRRPAVRCRGSAPHAGRTPACGWQDGGGEEEKGGSQAEHHPNKWSGSYLQHGCARRHSRQATATYSLQPTPPRGLT